MARIVKNQEKWHKLTIKDRYGGDLVLMGAGRQTTVSIWPNKENNFAYFAGAKTLRRLAYAILRETTPKSRRKGKDATHG